LGKKLSVEKRLTFNGFLKFDREIPLIRTLNLVQTTFVGIGTAIGGVMFAIMGKAIEAAGSSIVLTFLIGALFAQLIALSYAELGASVL